MSENENKKEKLFFFSWIADEMIFCKKNRVDKGYETSRQTKAHSPTFPLENATFPFWRILKWNLYQLEISISCGFASKPTMVFS